MRRRLVQSTLGVAIVAVGLLGVPLAVAAVLGQAIAAQRNVETTVGRIGSTVEGRLERGEEVTESVLDRLPPDAYGVVRVDGLVIASSGAPQTRPIQGEFRSARTSVYIEQSGAGLLGAQIRTVLLVLVASVVAVAAAVALGLLQARRLAEPLDDLAARARRLGAGETRPSFPRYGLTEVDEVADALDASAGRVAALLASERQFAADASHQLRTPLTALSMRLEEITESDDTAVMKEEARIALGQVERLSGVVDTLLASARHSRAGTAVPLDLDAILEQQLAEWAPAFTAADRSVELSGTRGLRAVATPGGVAQVVATLLENSLLHGEGRVLLRTRTTGTSVVVEVGDEGAGVPEEIVPHVFERAVSGGSSTGLGLALARDLAEGDGGRLALVRARPAVFALFLGVPDERIDEQLANGTGATAARSPLGRRRHRGSAGSSTTAGKTHRR